MNTEDRLAGCWPHQQCDSCLTSVFGCAWCGSSQTCVPLPMVHSPFLALLHPLRYPHAPEAMCAEYDDRWEVRTATFGCPVSNTTVFAILISVLAGMLALLFLKMLLRGLWSLIRLVAGSGWEIRPQEGYQGRWRRDVHSGWLLPWRKRCEGSGTRFASASIGNDEPLLRDAE